MKRTSAILLLPGLALGTFYAATGCGSSCEDTDSCGTYVPPGGSSGMSGGEAGDNGATGGGTGGISGASGGGTAGDGGAGGISGTSGEAGGGGAGGGEPPCDPSTSPSEDTCVIHEDYGVFVSPDGDDDSGDGTRSAPYATIGKGVEEASASGKRVYACADGGRYRETIALDESANDLELFGGFACADWNYGTSARSRVTSSNPLALRVENVSGLRIEDFTFEAADATAPGESSIGALIVNATSVLLRRVEIQAGSGSMGTSGTLTEFPYLAQSTLDGNSGVSGGAEKLCACQTGLESVGGAGGPPAMSGQAGSRGLPDHGAGQAGTPDNADCGNGGSGRNGAAAPNAPAAPGATTPGSIASTTGWTPSSGTNGSVGAPGQGGGGGASLNGTGRGGSGGCGGCGGNGGKGGQGGGASIAVLAFSSELVLDACTIVAGDGGDGGGGSPGQAGQQDVGGGGGVLTTLNACPGGNGGRGASGGAGGGGAGGISVGILWSGDAAPVRQSGTIVTGIAGAKGIGGDPGNNDGVGGVAQQVLEMP